MLIAAAIGGGGGGGGGGAAAAAAAGISNQKLFFLGAQNRLCTENGFKKFDLKQLFYKWSNNETLTERGLVNDNV